MKKQYNLYMDQITIEVLDDIRKNIKKETQKNWSRGEIITTLVAINGKEIEKYLIEALKPGKIERRP